MSRAGKYLKLDPLVSVLLTLVHAWKNVVTLQTVLFSVCTSLCSEGQEHLILPGRLRAIQTT